MRPAKPTHGLKSFSWTCCELILSFGLTTLNLVSCVLGFLMSLPGQLHRMVPYLSGAGFASYPLLPDACWDTGGSRCLR